TRCLSDWSSDVCSSDLHAPRILPIPCVIGIHQRVIRIVVDRRGTGYPEHESRIAQAEAARRGEAVLVLLHILAVETEASHGISRSEERRVGKAQGSCGS